MRCHIPLEDHVGLLNIFPNGTVSQEVPERPQMLDRRLGLSGASQVNAMQWLPHNKH